LAPRIVRGSTRRIIDAECCAVRVPPIEFVKVLLQVRINVLIGAVQHHCGLKETLNRVRVGAAANVLAVSVPERLVAREELADFLAQGVEWASLWKARPAS